MAREPSAKPDVRRLDQAVKLAGALERAAVERQQLRIADAASVAEHRQVAVEAVSTVVEAELCEPRLLLVGAAKQQLPKGRERRCGPPLGHERYAARRVVEPEGDARTRHSEARRPCNEEAEFCAGGARPLGR